MAHADPSLGRGIAHADSSLPSHPHTIGCTRQLDVIARALGIAQQTATEVRSVAQEETRLQREFARLVKEVRA